jgi:hypothetical protein
MCQHPTVQASGYVVSIDRDDYRTTLDDIDAEHLTSGVAYRGGRVLHSCRNGDGKQPGVFLGLTVPA